MSKASIAANRALRAGRLKAMRTTGPLIRRMLWRLPSFLIWRKAPHGFVPRSFMRRILIGRIKWI